MTTLLPCPFCGGEASTGQGKAYFFVNCIDCMASTDVLLAESREWSKAEAIAAWNRRAQTDNELQNMQGILANYQETFQGLHTNLEYWRKRAEKAEAELDRRTSAWQPIATAPRDGTVIWGYWPEFDEQMPFRYVKGDKWSGWLYTESPLNDCLDMKIQLTHWQPLPAPPAA